MTQPIAMATPQEAPAFAQYAFHPSSIVVPLDGSTDSEAALAVASYLATAFGVDIRVVHAIAEVDGSEDAAAASAFEQYVAELAPRGQLLRAPMAEVVSGAPVDVILAAASPDDLLVMATHGRGGLRVAMFGGVADKVLRGATCPTVAVPVTHERWYPPIQNIIIAVDDSDCATHATAVGRAFAERCGASVTIAHSYLPRPVAAGIDATYAYDSIQVAEAEERAAEALVAQVAAPGEEHRAVLGPTVEAIAGEAESLDADLVVTGAAHHGFFGRLVHGSVSEGLMHRLDRLLLVVPDRKD